MKKYIAVIDKDFGVIFPDFDGCVSVGKDLKDAIEMAQEALKFHVEGMREDGEELPKPKTLKQIKKEYPDNVIAKISNRLFLDKIEKNIVGTSKELEFFSEKSEKTDGEIININF